MPCNGYNHPADCECGWGGVWHGNQPYGGNNNRLLLKTPTAILSGGYCSYVNPNAHCPVCGAEVFFYQSPYGGRVFFDELGPPWPKHPCTDNGYTPRATNYSSTYPASRLSKNEAISNGWLPFYVETQRKERHIYRIKGQILRYEKYSTRSISLTLVVPCASRAPKINLAFIKVVNGFFGILDISAVETCFGNVNIINRQGVVTDDITARERLVARNGNAEKMNHLWVRYIKEHELGHTGSHIFSWSEIDNVFQYLRRKNNHSALNNMGLMYFKGHGVPKNNATAFRMVFEAAQSLYPTILENLAFFYENGVGVEPDLEMAAYLRELKEVK